MKILAVTAVVCMALAGAMAADDSYPHAFPRKGTVKLFENERVTVWEVNWLKNVMQPVHRH